LAKKLTRKKLGGTTHYTGSPMCMIGNISYSKIGRRYNFARKVDDISIERFIRIEYVCTYRMHSPSGLVG
jgi:hypothetical protein